MKILPERIQPVAEPAPNFTGPIKLELIVFNDPMSDTQVIKVTFPPGSRTYWHMHPKGQVLHITDGQGLVQEKGGDVYQVKPGDTVITEPGVWHWHGACPDASFTHYAIYPNSEVVSGSSVSEEEYQVPPAIP